MKNDTIKQRLTRNRLRAILITLVIISGIVSYYITKSWVKSALTLVALLALLKFGQYARGKLKAAARIRKMEEAFPDFLELMSSNLRAGMTIDRALLLSSREEFAPLDEEIIKLGKDIITGKEIERALKEMALRIKSEKINKTLLLIISGLRSGGNLATILEETAVNMRERSFVERRSSSNVLMYVIFIFFAIAVGAPVLFGLSSVLVEILTKLLSNIPHVDASTVKLPFTLTQISISTSFVTYFSLAFLIVINVLGSFVLGLVGKGEERAGLKYVVPLIVMSVTIFFLVKIFLSSFFAGIIG